MRAITPFNKKVERKIAEVETLPERHFLEAEEIIEGKRREGGDIALNLILLAASLKGSSSFEARVALDIFKDAVRNRVNEYISKEIKVSAYPEYEFCEAMKPELKLSPLENQEKKGELRFKVKWTELLPAVRSRKRKLTDFFIEKGYAILDEKEAIELFVEHLSEKAREVIESYSRLELRNERIEDLAEALSKASATRAERISSLQGKQAPLREEHFPPCIKLCLSGVGSGARNYAITVLLTSFLSYARIAPFSGQKDAKLSDFIDDISVIREEIMPLIEEAAQRCSPPLFEDQPLERLNVYYHLGLGLTSEPRLEDAGKSSWYFVPNCDKIRREAPSLCKPDKLCRDVKNPLTYYIKKRFSKEGKDAP